MGNRIGRTFIGGLALALLGCGAASTTQPVMLQSTVRQTRPGERYVAAAQAALTDYERELNEAATRWYPSYTEAYGTSLSFLHADFEQRLETALAERGLRGQALESYVMTNPEVVWEANRNYEQRIERLRPVAFYVMGRINADMALPTNASEAGAGENAIASAEF